MSLVDPSNTTIPFFCLWDMGYGIWELGPTMMMSRREQEYHTRICVCHLAIPTRGAQEPRAQVFNRSYNSAFIIDNSGCEGEGRHRAHDGQEKIK